MAMRKLMRRLKDRVLAARRRSARRKRVQAVRTVTRKAAKAGMIAGGLAAAGVVGRELGKRRARH
jgi:hypothetical protein